MTAFYRIPLVALLMLLLLLSGCNQKESEAQRQTLRLQGAIFGTYWEVSLVPKAGQTVEVDALRARIEARLQQVDQQMSTYREDSDLNRLNQHAPGEWLELPEQLMQVLALSQTIAEQSAGQFDVTVGGLVNLWSFGPEQRPLNIPDQQLLTERLSRVGYQYLQLDEEAQSARRMQDFFVDLSGVAKGYGVDQVGELLRADGFEHYLVNIGGDMIARGMREDGTPWRIGIELPHPGLQVAHHVVPLSNMSVATSGDYRNYFEVDGIRYSHTIDPLTGQPVNHKMASVTVFAADNASADAWATAMMVAGVESGLMLAERHQLKVLMLERVEDEWVTHLSSALKAYLGDEKTQTLLNPR